MINRNGLPTNKFEVNNNFFEIISQNISEVIGITDRNGTILYRSNRNKDIFGYAPEDIVGRLAFDFVHPDDLNRLKADFKDLLSLDENKSLTNQYRYLHKDGHYITIEITGRNMLNNPFIQGVLLTFHDISEKLGLIETLNESNERYNALIESTNNMVWSVEVNEFRLTTFNSFMSKYFKDVLNIEIKVGMTPKEIVPERIVNYWIELYKSVIEHGPRRIEYPMISSDRFLLLSLNPMYINDKLIGISVFTQDETEIRRITDKVREENTRYQTLIENMHDYVFEIDAETYDYIFFNSYHANFIFNVYGVQLRKGLNADTYMNESSLAFWKNACELAKINGKHSFQIRTFKGDSVINFSLHYLRNDKSKSSILVFGEDITKEKEYQEKLEQTNSNLELSSQKLYKQLQDSINAISKLGELRDAYTAGHQLKVKDLACRIAREMNLSETSISNISFGAMIHDIGKIYVPSEILNKPGKIDSLEMMIIKSHAEMGYKIIKEIEFQPEVSLMVLQHHERIDGSGYPNGLTGDNILIESKILSVADVVEAMSSHRPYRPAIGIELALEEIKLNSGTKYDPRVVETCLDLFINKQYKFPEIDYD